MAYLEQKIKALRSRNASKLGKLLYFQEREIFRLWNLNFQKIEKNLLFKRISLNLFSIAFCL
jgi:hypothetical protein